MSGPAGRVQNGSWCSQQVAGGDQRESACSPAKQQHQNSRERPADRLCESRDIWIHRLKEVLKERRYLM